MSEQNRTRVLMLVLAAVAFVVGYLVLDIEPIVAAAIAAPIAAYGFIDKLRPPGEPGSS